MKKVKVCSALDVKVVESRFAKWWFELIFWKASKLLIIVCIVGLTVIVGSCFSANIVLFFEAVMTSVVRCLVGMVAFCGVMRVILFFSENILTH